MQPLSFACLLIGILGSWEGAAALMTDNFSSKFGGGCDILFYTLFGITVLSFREAFLTFLCMVIYLPASW